MPHLVDVRLREIQLLAKMRQIGRDLRVERKLRLEVLLARTRAVVEPRHEGLDQGLELVG